MDNNFKKAAAAYDNQLPPDYYDKTITCEACDGEGINPETEEQCNRCDGKGEITFDTRTNLKKSHVDE